ncbi:alcohol dehydrogenase [Candidatus Methylomirabilis lanthanidiphila]|uniref:Alcohol dehydrogenase n=1 Tax=Candidatus Methylomirabilis lanthanidiphila TaxID=2211376 RepID=A0A564ZGD7_9BACT|nr:zinc-binding dehydrogenase [Candidatus Methylomirabilis lanthanidiphila]VUZ84233.1 alcohol dehydrogenase [Candidatus Methylomirabilis lanthanidiphila]
MSPVETLNRTMMAAVLHGPEDVQLEEVPIPQIGPKDILARVEAASIDFTDRKVYLRGSHPMIQIPGLFGHEWAGVVVARGEQADGRWQPGMRVVAANSAPCADPNPAARCRACRRARQGMCERLLYNNGAFAPYIRIPGRIAEVNLYELPTQVPFEEAALAEPLACVMHAVRRVPIADGDRIVIVGAGPIGLMFTAILRHRYGRSIRLLSVDHHDDRLDLAKSFGADVALNSAGGLEQAGIRAAFGVEGADVVIEAVGSLQAHREAFELVGRGGTLVPFGGVAEGTVLSLDLHRLHYEEIRIIPIYHHTPADFAGAVQAIICRDVPVSRLITARLPLKELPRALEMVQERTTLRTILYPWS